MLSGRHAARKVPLSKRCAHDEWLRQAVMLFALTLTTRASLLSVASQAVLVSQVVPLGTGGVRHQVMRHLAVSSCSKSVTQTSAYSANSSGQYDPK